MRIKITKAPPIASEHAVKVGNVYEAEVNEGAGRGAARVFIKSHTTGERVGLMSHEYQMTKDSTPLTIARKK